MDYVLKLNASYEPLEVIHYRKAIVLLLEDKVESVLDSKRIIRSPNIELVVPSVVRLKRYVKIPYGFIVNTPTKLGVLRRDGHRCGYCRNAATTVDHITPKSKGGGNSWKNLVACCYPCNQKKADRTLEQIQWMLLYEPYVPSNRANNLIGKHNADWQIYLDYV